MRRSRIALLVIAAITAAACAHPTEDPLPGETPAPTTSTRRTTTSTPSGEDETEIVCEQAIERSDEVVAEIREKILEARSNPSSATAALLAVRTTATEWKEDLEGFAERPIRGEVRETLQQGIDLIDDLLGKSPQEIAEEADQAQEDIENFLDDLESACA